MTNLEEWLRTDAGNVEYFAKQFSGKVKYNCTIGKWMEYDNMRWNSNRGNGAAERHFSDLGKVIWQSIAHSSSAGDREKLLKWGEYVNSARGLRNGLSLAKSHKDIEVFATDFDQDPYMLNCEDGTIDLHSGQLQPHRADDKITQLAPVRFKEDTGIELWMNCLKTWHSGDMETIEYLQELAGMCLTGDTSSRVFPIFYGSGKNGKSVFLDTLMGILGDYATVAPRTLLKQTRYDAHPTELAGLFGKRLVLASETEQMRLKVDVVKSMTGDKRITARFMRGDFFDFTPTHKTILVSQHLPIITETADAIWDRVHKLGWEVRITDAKQDTHLLGKLEKEWPGILKWCVEGCLKWQQDGTLKRTKSIREQTETYRKEQRPLSDFIEDMCVIGLGCFVPLSELYVAYKGWRDYAETFREFNKQMRDLSYRSKERKINTKTVKCWIGLGLCTK